MTDRPLSAEKRGLCELVTELADAMVEHENAERESSVAQGALTEARNRLNRAQKAIDERMTQMRKEAPWNTDWHTKRGITESLP